MIGNFQKYTNYKTNQNKKKATEIELLNESLKFKYENYFYIKS